MAAAALPNVATIGPAFDETSLPRSSVTMPARIRCRSVIDRSELAGEVTVATSAVCGFFDDGGGAAVGSLNAGEGAGAPLPCSPPRSVATAATIAIAPAIEVHSRVGGTSSSATPTTMITMLARRAIEGAYGTENGLRVERHPYRAR